MRADGGDGHHRSSRASDFRLTLAVPAAGIGAVTRQSPTRIVGFYGCIPARFMGNDIFDTPGVGCPLTCARADAKGARAGPSL
jgi:hypothetical protein